MPFLPDAFAEIREVEAFLDRQAQAGTMARSLGQADVARIAEIADYYPHLTPDAVMALGRSGLSARSPQVAQAAEIEARRMLRYHPTGQHYGAPSITPGQRREMTSRQNATAIPTWRPQTNNPDAAAAWNEARRAGLVQDGILTRPSGPDAERLSDTYLDIVDRLTAAGEQVPTMVMEDDGWQARILTRGPSPSVAEQMHAGAAEARRQAQVPLIAETIWTEKDGRLGGGTYGGRLGGGLTAELPGAEARTRYERGQTLGTQSAGVDALRETLQAVFATLDVPVQETQGLVRNLYGATHGRNVDWWETQSDLGISLTTSIDDMGQGMFVDQESEVAQERRRREAERGQIGGHNITLGRWVADATPFATDSRPALLLSGLVDLGVQLKDPSGFVLGRFGDIAMARQFFRPANLAGEADAGVLRSLRTVFHGPTAQAWLDSAEGAARLDWLSRTNDPYMVARGMNRKITMDFANQLADAHSPEAVRAVLEPELGRGIREVSTVAMPGNQMLGGAVGYTSPVARRPAAMPIRGPIDAHDKDIVAWEMEAWLHNAGASDAELSHHISRVARAESPIQLNRSIMDSLSEARGILERSGVPSAKLRSRLTRIQANAHQEASTTFRAAMTSQTPTYNSLVNRGELVHDVGANLYVEHAPRHITLPDARDVRRVRSKFAPILAKGDTGKLRLPFATAEFLSNEIWKPFQLVTRIAWPTRVIAEEQVRMAAAGYDSVFRHPISYITAAVGRGHTDMVGNLIDDANETKAAFTQGHGGWIDRHIASPGAHLYTRANTHEREAFVRAWASEQYRLYGDPVANHIANGSSLDDSKNWFTRGAGNKFRGEMATAHPEKFNTQEQAHAYMEIVAQRINRAHGGHTDLADVVRTGTYNGKPIYENGRFNKAYLERLDELADDFAPEKLAGDAVDGGSFAGLREQVFGGLDQATNTLFGWLMTKPTNYLSRGPTFRQAYWKHATRYIGFADQATKDGIIEAAEAAGVSRRQIKRMRHVKATGDNFNTEQIDVLAKGAALDETKELLYDLTRRGRTMDAWRVVFPFGEAWSEVMTRWFGKPVLRRSRMGLPVSYEGGLVWKNPKTVRRFQQLVQGARGEQFGELLGSPTDREGNHLGFFWTNSFGEEVFVYPGSQILSEHTVGVPVPLTGRVQGLSMFGTIMPGLGLAAQIPVGWFLASKPGPQRFKEFLNDVMAADLGPLGTVKEQILPFGGTGEEDVGEIFDVTNYMPPWIRSALDAVSEGDLREDAYASDVMDVMAYLATTGRFDDTVAGRQALAEQAENDARQLYFLRALVGNVAPASPDFEFMVEGDHGGLLRLAALRDEFFGMLDADPRTGAQSFLDKYGPDIHAVVATPQTTSSRRGTPTTTEGVNWVLENPGIEDDLPHTYGMFAPEGGPEDFSIYRREMRENERDRLKPRTWLRLLNNTKGNIIWQQAKDMIEGSPNRDEQEWLRDVADAIEAEHPGWGDPTGRLEDTPVDILVAELEQAVDHPALRRTDAVEGLRVYLRARTMAEEAAEDSGLSPNGFKDAERMEDTRLWLNDVAGAIIEEHPDFEPLWRWVFSRELELED